MLGRKVRFGEYEVDFARFELRKRGVRIGLQRKPFRVLELLLRRPGELVTREELFNFLWPDSHVSFEHGLNTAVNSLRQVLGESSRDCHFIETRPGLGYRFSAPVEEVIESDSKQTSSPISVKNVAREDFLKGHYFLDKLTEDDIYKALAFFKAAADDESCAPLAHTGIADAYCQLALLGSLGSSKLAGQARASVDFALRNSPDLAPAHVSEGRMKILFDWDWESAHDAVNRALTLDADSISAHTLRASLLSIAGRHEEALDACRRAITLDPLSFSTSLQFAACLHAAHDFQGVVDQCWKILVLTPCFAPAQILLALAYEQLDMWEEAIVELENVRHCPGFQAMALSGIGHIYATMNRRAEAEQALSELSAQGQNGHVSPYWQAIVYSGMKRHSEALASLAEAIRRRDPVALWTGADARLDKLRDHDQYQMLLQQIRASKQKSTWLPIDRCSERAAASAGG
ncbi:MAG TPA: winged helix-turn-helix domain-containing protein [Bryobacteraceae bacterium]|nr:winged helix-turn-helix domain-containing protein [Bryobacteraceae bacterium]